MYIGNYTNSYYNTLFGGKTNKASSAFSSLGSIGSVYSASKAASSNLYNSIFNKNSNTINNNALGFVSQLKTGASEMTGALRSLQSGAAFRQTSLSSSDTGSMTVEGFGILDKEKSVKIDQIASGQVNEGTALRADEKAGAASRGQFIIETGGKSHMFNVNVSSTDTNKDIQQKMAKAINERGIGITASVTENTADKTSSLVVRANGTGDDQKNKFSISDGLGSLIAKTGADKITSEAADAIYSINGGENKTSKTNTVSLGDGVTATLKKASDTAITVSNGKDADFALDKVRQMADSYNKLYSATVSEGSDSARSDRLFNRLVGTSRTYAGSLAKIGIGFDTDGKMTVDADKVKSALNDGKLERFFTENSGRSFGFANQLGRIADSVTNNTGMYVSKSAFGNSLMNIMGYGNGGTLATNLFSTSGLLFDFKL